MKRTRDEALEYVRAALRENSNPLTKQEMSFIRTSCHILGIDGGKVAKAIVKGAKDEGKKQPRKVMEHLQSQLRELAERVEKHKRPTPNPAASTRAVDAMGAPARSLGNLLGCAEALREATKGQYSKGIKAAIKAMENAKLDFKATID
jgi:Tfp pilus assembly protein FimV